jgi:FK506-binding protein 2
MQLLKVWFSLLSAAVCILAAQHPTELLIETTFMPDACSEKAHKGDTVSVHYVSS